MRTYSEIGSWLVKYLGNNETISKAIKFYLKLFENFTSPKAFKYRLAQDMYYIDKVDDKRLTERDKADVKALWEFMLEGENDD